MLNNMEGHQYLGSIGYYGATLSEERNLKIAEANKLVDTYNLLVNSFKTYDEQSAFFNKIKTEIDEILK
jgi:hypothetical protein